MICQHTWPDMDALTMPPHCLIRCMRVRRGNDMRPVRQITIPASGLACDAVVDSLGLLLLLPLLPLPLPRRRVVERPRDGVGVVDRVRRRAAMAPESDSESSESSDVSSDVSSSTCCTTSTRARRRVGGAGGSIWPKYSTPSSGTTSAQDRTHTCMYHAYIHTVHPHTHSMPFSATGVEVDGFSSQGVHTVPVVSNGLTFSKCLNFSVLKSWRMWRNTVCRSASPCRRARRALIKLGRRMSCDQYNHHGELTQHAQVGVCHTATQPHGDKP